MKDRLLKMFQLQEQLNRKINENWKNIRTKEDFARATWIECAELVDSLPWKWWKKMEADINNVKIEIVDIYHFIMSYTLLDVDIPEEVLSHQDIKMLIKGITEDFHNIDIPADYINHYLGETNYHKKLIFLTERVAQSYLEQNSYAGNFFFGLLVKNSMDFKEFYLLYMGKNILNHIRQEMGYKQGTYKKNINGMEDNQYLLHIVKNITDEKTLEEKLRKEFKKLQEG
ncbi:MAG: dUTPase [Aquificae bacterium]|nr:dUTPase [Aquificota bacterium]